MFYIFNIIWNNFSTTLKFKFIKVLHLRNKYGAFIKLRFSLNGKVTNPTFTSVILDENYYKKKLFFRTYDDKEIVTEAKK